MRRCLLVKVTELNLPNSAGSSEMGFPSSSNVFRDLSEQNHKLHIFCIFYSLQYTLLLIYC